MFIKYNIFNHEEKKKATFYRCRIFFVSKFMTFLFIKRTYQTIYILFKKNTFKF
jgi:hypothetical protein